jgi:hypothetical protein
MTQTTKSEIYDAVKAMFSWHLTNNKAKGLIMKPSTNADIESAISTLVGNAQMFSHYDVTKTLRNSGFHVMHNDVKLLVGAYQFPYNYGTKTIKVKGAPAIIHYPDHLDPSGYNPDLVPEPIMQVAVRKIIIGNQTQPQMRVAISPTTKRTIAVPTNRRSGMVSFDQRGRANVPASFFAAGGFNAGDKVICYFALNRIEICEKSNVPAGSSLSDKKSYTIDHHSALRICGSDFRKAFDVNDQIEITAGNGVVWLKKK